MVVSGLTTIILGGAFKFLTQSQRLTKTQIQNIEIEHLHQEDLGLLTNQENATASFLSQNALTTPAGALLDLKSSI